MAGARRAVPNAPSARWNAPCDAEACGRLPRIGASGRIEKGASSACRRGERRCRTLRQRPTRKEHGRSRVFQLTPRRLRGGTIFRVLPAPSSAKARRQAGLPVGGNRLLGCRPLLLGSRSSIPHPIQSPAALARDERSWRHRGRAAGVAAGLVSGQIPRDACSSEWRRPARQRFLRAARCTIDRRRRPFSRLGLVNCAASTLGPTE